MCHNSQQYYQIYGGKCMPVLLPDMYWVLRTYCYSSIIKHRIVH